MDAIPLDHSYSSTEPAPDLPQGGKEEAEAENSDIEDGCTELPTSRIEIIMKSCLGIKKVKIPEDTLLLVSKCTELFIKDLTQTSFEMKKQEEPSTESLDYEAVSNVVDRCQKFEFLSEIIPKKITFARCKELLRKKEIEESMPNWKPPKPAPRRPRKKKVVEKKSEEKLIEPALVPLQSQEQAFDQWPSLASQGLPMLGSQWSRGPNPLNLQELRERMPVLPPKMMGAQSSQMMTFQPFVQTGQAELLPQRKMAKQKPKQSAKKNLKHLMMPAEMTLGIPGDTTFQAPIQMRLPLPQPIMMKPEDTIRARGQITMQAPRHLPSETTVMMPKDMIIRAPRQMTMRAPRQMTMRAPRQVRIRPSEATRMMPRGMVISATERMVMQNQEQMTMQAPERDILGELRQVTMMEQGRSALQELRQMTIDATGKMALEEPRQMTMQAPGHIALKKPIHMTMQVPGHATLQEPRQMTMQAPGYTALQKPIHMTMQTPGHATLQEPRQMTMRAPGQMTARPLGRKTVQMPRHMSMPAPRRMPTSTYAQGLTSVQLPHQFYEPRLQMAAQTLVQMSKSKPVQIPDQLLLRQAQDVPLIPTSEDEEEEEQQQQ